MRAFVALDLDEGLLDAAVRVQKKLEKNAPKTARFTSREKLHVTLRFFAWIDDEEAKAIALEAKSALPIVFDGLDAFPSPRRATVVVIRIRDEDGAIASLASEEGRPFRPHLTIARLRRPTDVREWLVPIEPEAGSAIAITLYESRSGIYVPITSTRFP